MPEATARIAAAQVRSANGLLVVGTRAIGKTTLARATAERLSDGWAPAVPIERKDGQTAAMTLRGG